MSMPDKGWDKSRDQGLKFFQASEKHMRSIWGFYIRILKRLQTFPNQNGKCQSCIKIGTKVGTGNAFVQIKLENVQAGQW